MPGLILAAGRGDRFRRSGGGGPKVLSELDGRPLIGHVIAAAVDAGLRPLIIVVPEGLELPEAARHPAVESVVNPDPDGGIGASLALGLSAVASRVPDAPACTVLLGDQPGVDSRTIADVLGHWIRTGRPVRAQYDDGPGHPVILPRALWAGLRSAHPEWSAAAGARRLLEQEDALRIPIPGRAPRDVDTLDDLLQLRGSPADG